jgi:ABC-type nickel/cobalt efflux system permease component RcnA
MIDHAAVLLIATVAAVGVLHTVVPDHWAPIVVLARQQGWSVVRTARSAALAGFGHVTTTLLLGALLWVVGASLAARYAHFVSLVSALALLVFGLWIAYGGWKNIRGGHEHEHGYLHFEHAHLHQHEDGVQHVHWHEHHEADWHGVEGGVAVTHMHEHAMAGRTALLLILGSSPMVEGIPAFLGASTKGPGLLAVMAIVFAFATIATYMVMCVAGVRGLQRTSLGPLERYGEVLSGVFVAAVGIYALFTF